MEPRGGFQSFERDWGPRDSGPRYSCRSRRAPGAKRSCASGGPSRPGFEARVPVTRFRRVQRSPGSPREQQRTAKLRGCPKRPPPAAARAKMIESLSGPKRITGLNGETPGPSNPSQPQASDNYSPFRRRGLGRPHLLITSTKGMAMNSTKILLIGAAVALGSGTAIVQAQTQAAAPAAAASPATTADPSSATPAAPAVKAAPADPLAPAASSADTAGAEKSATAPDPQTVPVKGKSKKKPR